MAQPEPLVRFFAAYKLTEAELRQILEDAAEEAERLIPKLVEKHTTGNTIKAAQLALILREIRSQQSAMWGDVNGVLKEGMQRAALAAVAGESAIDAYLRRNGLAMPELHQSFRAQAMRGFRNVVAKGFNNIPLSTQVYRTQALAMGWVDRQVRKALILQTDAHTLARQVRQFIDPSVKGGVSFAAFRLARTELNNAFHTVAKERFEEPWATGVQWHLSGSHPPAPSGNPEACEVLARTDLGLGTGVFPVGEVPDKPHPQCLCYITQQVVGEDEFLDKLVAGDYDGFLAEQLGQDPPKKDPAAEWLATYGQDKSRKEADLVNNLVRGFGVSRDDAWDMVLKARGKPPRKRRPSKSKPKPAVVVPIRPPAKPAKPAASPAPQPVRTPDVVPTTTPDSATPVPSQAPLLTRAHIDRITTLHISHHKKRTVAALENQARFTPRSMTKLNEVKYMDQSAPSYGVPGVVGEYDERYGTMFLDISAFQPQAKTVFEKEKRSNYISKCGEHFDSLDNLIAHEYGHHMHDLWLRAPIRKRVFGEIAKVLGVEPPQFFNTDRILAWGEQHKVLIASLVSRYGATNPLEMMAEIWAEYTLGDPPRPHIQAIGEIMRRAGEELS